MLEEALSKSESKVTEITDLLAIEKMVNCLVKWNLTLSQNVSNINTGQTSSRHQKSNVKNAAQKLCSVCHEIGHPAINCSRIESMMDVMDEVFAVNERADDMFHRYTNLRNNMHINRAKNAYLNIDGYFRRKKYLIPIFSQ